MDGWVLNFIGACISSLLWTALPTPLTTTIYLTFSLLLLLRFSDYPFSKCISGFLAGLVWISSVGHWHEHWQLQDQDFHESIMVSGEIASLTSPSSSEQRFMMRVDRIGEQKRRLVPLTFRLSWFKPLWELKQGQEVRFFVKVKPAHGLANEGTFNYQQWLFTQNVTATGYVKPSDSNAVINHKVSLRQYLLDKIHGFELSNSKWIVALSLGYRGALDDSDWDLLQRTGTSHLVAISGLHIGVVAIACYGLFSYLLMTLTSFRAFRFNISILPFSLSLTLATVFFYAYLAGFSLPTARACLMLFVVSLLLLFNRTWSSIRCVCCVLLIVILIAPTSLYGISLWLSLSAVLIILFSVWRWPLKNNQKRWISAIQGSFRLQIIISLFMFPIIAWQFSLISLSAPSVNFIAVPLVTLILVPLCLLATLLTLLYPAAGFLVFKFLDTLFDVGIGALSWAGSSPMTHVMVKDYPVTVWLIFASGLICLLLPKLPFPKYLCVIWLLPLMSLVPPQKKAYWQVDVLDVGQGLAVLLSRNNKVILYDTGPSFPSGFNMAKAVIIPLLQSRGIHELDLLIISHNDNDHAGGISYLNEHFDIRRTITSEDVCFYGWQKQWEGLELEALWPLQPMSAEENDSSCVVSVSDEQFSVLLTGDIDKYVERKLIDNQLDKLASNIVVAPHHGSNSSSSDAFVRAVKPQFSVFSQGFRNRWRFPREEVVKRYGNLGVKTYSTSKDGQVIFKISEDEIKALSYRHDIYPYWYANE